MKAVVCYGENIVKFENVSEPHLKEGEVKIRVKACGICGSDIPRALEKGAHNYPIILGHEFSGIVEEFSDNVSHIECGDHVVVAPLVPCYKCEDCLNGNYALCKKYSFIGSRQQGGMAEFVVVPQKNVIKISKNIPFEIAALFEPATVALHAFKQFDYQPQKTVAILGGGTIGIFAMQWAKLLGAKKVVVFGRDKEHLQLSLKLGADAIISTLDDNFIELAYSETGNKGFDYIIETAGSTKTIKYSFYLAANKAKICLVGTPTTNLTFTDKEWELINRKEFNLSGSWMSYSAPFPGKEWEMTKDYFKNGKLKVCEKFYNLYHAKMASEVFNKYKTSKVRGRSILIF